MKGTASQHTSEIAELMGSLFKSHPWHGISSLGSSDGLYQAYIEMVPVDTVKYEVDKHTGHLKVDRPQKYSSLCPTLYGFIPQTYCGDLVGAHAAERTGRPGIKGDGDPIDVCVITEKPITHGEIIVPVIPLGGLRMLDRHLADDKIIAVLKDDASYGTWRDIHEVPQGLQDRLRHYFLTYKELPGGRHHEVEITHVYGRDEALEVIRRAMADYRTEYGDPAERLSRLLSLVIAKARGPE